MQGASTGWRARRAARRSHSAARRSVTTTRKQETPAGAERARRKHELVSAPGGAGAARAPRGAASAAARPRPARPRARSPAPQARPQARPRRRAALRAPAPPPAAGRRARRRLRNHSITLEDLCPHTAGPAPSCTLALAPHMLLAQRQGLPTQTCTSAGASGPSRCQAGGAHGAAGSATRPRTQKDYLVRCGVSIRGGVMAPGSRRSIERCRQLHEADGCACLFTHSRTIGSWRGRAIQHSLVQADRVCASAQLRVALRHALQQRERVVVRVRTGTLKEAQRLHGPLRMCESSGPAGSSSGAAFSGSPSTSSKTSVVIPYWRQSACASIPLGHSF